jgi:ABC-type transporter Mla subunit MlaD
MAAAASLGSLLEQRDDALIKLIDRLPRLVNPMDDDTPLLDRLDQSGPDLNQLLDSVSDLNRMANHIPKDLPPSPVSAPDYLFGCGAPSWRQRA